MVLSRIDLRTLCIFFSIFKEKIAKLASSLPGHLCVTGHVARLWENVREGENRLLIEIRPHPKMRELNYTN